MKNVHRSIAFGLATFLLAIAFPASALQDPTYVGTTAQGEPIEFDVERRDVLTLTRIETITTQVCDDGATFHDHRAVLSWPVVKEGVPLLDRYLSMYEEDERTTIAINGNIGTRTASGDMEVKYQNGAASCRSGQVFWTAERVRTTATGWLYRGTTSQSGRLIRFRIDLQERALVLTAYSVYVEEPCEDGTSLSYGSRRSAWKASPSKDARSTFPRVTMTRTPASMGSSWRARRPARSGRTPCNGGDGSGEYPCTTGELTWTAERVPHSG